MNVLGACVMCPEGMQRDLVRQCSRHVNAGDFLSDRCRAIWKAITTLVDAGTPADLVTIAGELRKNGGIDDSMRYVLASLGDGVPKSTHAPHYARMLAEVSGRRNLASAAVNLKQAIEDCRPDLPAYVRDVEDAALSARPGQESIQHLDLGNLRRNILVPWRVNGWLGKTDLVIVGAEGGTGKSVLSMELALALCTGTPFLGLLGVPAPCPVVIFDQENPEMLAERRLAMLCAGRDIDPATLPLLYVTQRKIRLDDEKGRDLVRRQIEEHQAGFVVLDSLVRFHTCDENSNSEMSRIFDEMVGPMRDEYGCGFCVLHHLAKPSKDRSELYHRLRGASDLPNMVDAFWGLEGERKTPNRTLTSEKCRWRPDLAKPLALHYDQDEAAGTAHLEAVEVRDSAERSFMGALSACGASGVLRATLLDLAAQDGISSKQASRILARLHDTNRVRKSAEGKAMRYYLAEA